MKPRLLHLGFAATLASCAAPSPLGWPPGNDADWAALEHSAIPAKPGPAASGDDWECALPAGAVCRIDIPVVNGACQPTQQKVHVTRDIVVMWKIATPGWKFASNGIAFKSTTPPPPDGFDQPGGNGRTTYIWHAKPGAPAGTYDYAVNLVGPTGATCYADPGLWV